MNAPTPPNHTASAETSAGAKRTLDIYTLLNHDFVAGVESGAIKKARHAYRQFTIDVAELYHSDYSRREVRTALIFAEDELTLILKMEDVKCEVTIEMAKTAIQFLRTFLTHLLHDITPGTPVTTPEREIKDETKSQPAKEAKPKQTVFKWTYKFTDFVEYFDGILEMECVRIDNRGTSNFIQTLLDLFGLDKSVKDFNRARNKLSQKNPDEGEPRGKFLLEMHENLEEAWQKRWMAS